MEGSTLSPYANKAAAANDIDKKLAKELNEMSFNDRNILQEEIHCVNSATMSKVLTFV
jgi:DNA-binding MltR family transcriptional regulator